MKKIELPVELPKIPPHGRPTVNYENDWSELTYALLVSRLRDIGIEHDASFGSTLFDTAQTGSGKGHIVELGTFSGWGSIHLAAGSKSRNREKVFTIDNYACDWHPFYNETPFWGYGLMAAVKCKMNFKMLGLSDWINMICCSTVDAAEVMDLPVRVLVIDASHDYISVVSDIFSWCPKVIPGGILIIHDWSFPDVRKAMTEYIQDSDEWSDITEISNMVATAVKL